jgi:hypothetical protein
MFIQKSYSGREVMEIEICPQIISNQNARQYGVSYRRSSGLLDTRHTTLDGGFETDYWQEPNDSHGQDSNSGGFHGGDYDECRLLGCDAALLFLSQ